MRPTYLDDPNGARWAGAHASLCGQDLDHVDAALPALEAALVHARLDIMVAQALDAALSLHVILGHELDPHIPQLPTGDLHDGAVSKADVETGEGDF